MNQAASTGGRQARAFLGACAIVILVCLVLPRAATARELWSYPISEEQCGPGTECLRRMGAVTNNGSDGAVKVGGTPKANPFNPSACPSQPKNKGPGTAAYSSLGWDPGNPANAEKYNVKKIKPIDGWPGEWHLEVDDNLRAWRDSVLVRGKKAGAKTVEADNSDIPGYDLGRIAAQLNHECDMHKAFGEPCPLKNNPEILGRLNYRPDYWILETGSDNGGTSLIQKAKSSGLPGDAIYIVHYGSPSAEVCNMIPGSHVVFAKTKDLKVSNLSPCPGAPGGSAPPPAPSQLAGACQPQEKPQQAPPQDPVAQNPPQAAPFAPSAPAAAAASRAPAPSAPPGAQEAAEYPTPRPRSLAAPAKKASPAASSFAPSPAKDETADTSVITGRELGDGHFASAPAFHGQPEAGAGHGFGGDSLTGQGPSRFAAAGAGRGLASNGASGGQATEGGSPRPQPPAGKSASPAAGVDAGSGAGGGASGRATGEVLSAFAGKKLGDPKLPVTFEDLDSAKQAIATDLGIPGEQAGAGEDNPEARTLFDRIRGCLLSAQRGGRVSRRP